MLAELAIYTTVATATTAAPVYKIRKLLGKLFKIPVIGWLLILGYGFGMSWVLLNVFSMQSSIAGLANMLSSVLFAVWIYFQSKK